MNPAVAKRFKETSIEGSRAKFTWGIKNGKALAVLLPNFRFAAEHSLTEGMAAFLPIYADLQAAGEDPICAEYLQQDRGS